jgi:cell wall-associated NlpC family hydrolase
VASAYFLILPAGALSPCLAVAVCPAVRLAARSATPSRKRGGRRKIVRGGLLWLRDTWGVAVAGLVARVEQVLCRAHGLFGDPPVSGGQAALEAGSRLAGAGQLVRGGAQQISRLSGEMPTRYGIFAADAGSTLDDLAGTDAGLRAALDDAGGADRSGQTDSGAVLRGAAADTAGLAAVSHTPAGEKALIAALRARVAQQQSVVAAYRTRDAQLAGLLRSVAYARRGRSGAGMPESGGIHWGGSGLGGMPGTAMLPGRSGLAGMPARSRHPRAALVSRTERRTDQVPGSPGQAAVRAALGKLGQPYVWGAKGPSSFDCSGLTSWAWRQAGIQLGADTYEQIHDGIAVPPGQVRAGDLIFPRDAFDAAGPGHVQLAISPTQVIHAPQPGDVVRIAPMPSAYVARRPVPLA